jgi:hypothetical protein
MLIGLVGYKQSGKDTIANWLVENKGYTKRAFAQPIKEICSSLFGITEEQLYNPAKKELKDNIWGMSPRVMMQKVGEGLRNVHNDCLTLWMKRELLSLGDSVVISDIRLEDEIKFVKDNNGFVIYVDREHGGNRTDNDITETSVNKISQMVDFHITNNGTHDKLFDEFGKLYVLMEKIYYGTY